MITLLLYNHNKYLNWFIKDNYIIKKLFKQKELNYQMGNHGGGHRVVYQPDYAAIERQRR